MAWSACVHAQQEPKFELIDVSDGLSHGAVNSILRDSQGYVWFGTLSGLNLYDGYSVKTFTYDPRDSSSLSSTEVLQVFEGPEQKIWVQTTNGLNIYDHRLQSFSQDIGMHLANYGIPDTDIQSIRREAEHIFWFISTDSGVFRYNMLDGTTVNLSASSTSNGIESNSIADLKISPAGNIWILYNDGLLQEIDSKLLQVVGRFEEFSEVFGGVNESLQMTIDSDGELWIFIPNSPEGIFHLNPESRQLKRYNETSRGIKLNTNLVTAAVEVKEGEIWVGTDHGGINVINKQEQSVKYYLSQPEVPNSLVHNSIYSMYKDAEGITWIGTYKNGVNFYHESLKRFNLHKHFSSIQNSLPFDDVNRFVEDLEGNLWIGTNGGGLLYFNRKQNTYKQYVTKPNDPNSLSSNVIVSLSMARDGKLWIGTYLGGLDRFDGSKFEHFKNNVSDPASISGNNVWEMLKDSDGELWISTLNGGLDKVNEQSGEFSHIYLSEQVTDTTLTANFIYEIEEDHNGDIWVAGGGGIDLVDRKTQKVNLNKPAALNALVGNTITSLHKDSFGRMWIGTQEGLYVYGVQGELTLLTTADGLPHNAILTIVEDDDRNLWFSTPNGISNLVFDNPEQNLKGKFINYDETDGLQGKVFNENAALKLSTGEIVFGGANGFNIFHPDNLSPNTTIPKVVFTDFQLFNQSLKVGEEHNGRNILESSLNSLDQLVLKHNENVFSIEFAALNFLHAQKNEYKYMLEGFDEDWRTADLTRRVTYTNLDAGDYTFKVIASNNDGIWNEEGTSLKIAILPPFYATKWAYAFYVLLIVLALYIARRMIIAKARVRYQIEQERREARQLHELDLMKIRFLTNISHEFRTPLSLILAPLDKLIGNSEKDEKKQFLMIKRNAKRLLNLVNQLLDFRKLEVDTIELNKSEGNIIKFIEESVHSFADLSENKRIQLSFQADREVLYTSFDMDKLEKILFNLLSNAFKFTSEYGKVSVRVKCFYLEEATEAQRILELKVEDTGIGIPKEKRSKVFDRFFRNDVPGSVVNQGSGIGLSITREFVRIHGGTIELESEEGKGTCFTVRIPVKELSNFNESESFSKTEEYITSLENQTETDETTMVQDGVPMLLLVEDNEDFRFYLKDNLKEHFKIVGARHGKEGWQKCLSVLPDLVVSDLMMPEMDGIELCKKVKEDSRTSHIPFILLTADAKDESKLKGINTGADDYVTKPFNYEILLSRINNLIAQHKSMQETYSRRISVETSQAEITSLSDKLIQDAIRIVEENISDPDFSVEMLSHELGLSRAHLYKKMVSLTGLTPVEFIRKIRIQRAAQFLKKSELTIAEVAYKVGFNNRKYFSKYFKQEYNMLPSSFASEHNS